MAVCAETIYRACYANNNTSGLKAGSWQSLPRGRRRRKPRSRCETAKRSALGPYRPLTQRPQQADDRSEPGHWEGDLMIGANNASAIATMPTCSTRAMAPQPVRSEGARPPRLSTAFPPVKGVDTKFIVI